MVGGCFHCPECKLYTRVWLAMLSCCYSPMATMSPQKREGRVAFSVMTRRFSVPEYSLLIPTGSKATTHKKLHRAHMQAAERKLGLLMWASQKTETVTNHIHHILVVSLCKQTSHTDLTPYPGSSSGKVIHPQQRQPSVLGQELHKWKSFSQTSIGSLESYQCNNSS